MDLFPQGLVVAAATGIKIKSVRSQLDFNTQGQSWMGSVVDYSIVPIGQSCGFDHQLGHIQESTNECINK